MKMWNKFILILFFVFTNCKSVSNYRQEINGLYPPSNVNIPYHTEWARHHYPLRIRHFKKNPLNYDDIVFIGNSITESGGDWGKRLGLENVKNRGISGDVTEGVLSRLNEIVHYNPKAVIILIGINDMFNEELSPEYIANNIFKITDVIVRKSPKTAIYVQTILPTSNQHLIEKILKTNKILKEKKGAFELIDIYEIFVDNSNGLIQEKFTYDGTHLTEIGYNHWAHYLKSTILNKP
ncbi:GDSL-type esterase/lipase family protein [Seonamhaeicola sp.]|uniref:GDSL-type esterase/lipase family protein n=1 Tax=Seonamhaeicola sp. TaxID=1912245 RepID=UPI00262C5E29|nr:GDSL-type esterase/lipase family protein [Seonamhaeicola sp.]